MVLIVQQLASPKFSYGQWTQNLQSRLSFSRQASLEFRSRLAWANCALKNIHPELKELFNRVQMAL